MSEKPLPFVITDRRKFTAEGEPRPDADPDPEREARTLTPQQEPAAASHASADEAIAEPPSTPQDESDDALPEMPPPPTAEQMEQSRLAFDATADRLDTAIRAANPGMDHPPAMNFEQIVQSVYMQAILQLGGGTQSGQQPQVDILGAKQSIDMLGILNEKTANNLTDAERTLLESALFELRLAFLEITQALARSAQQRATQAPGAGGPQPVPGRPGPSIVR